MAKHVAIAKRSNSQGQSEPGTSRKRTTQRELITAMNAHTEALHRFSNVIEKANLQGLVAKTLPTLGDANILKLLAALFHKPDLSKDDAFSVISAGANISVIANVINNIEAFNQRGLALSPNDIDSIKTVRQLIAKISAKLKQARGGR